MPSARLTDLGLFFTFIDVIDGGASGQRVSDLAFSGDLGAAFAALSENAKSVFDQGVFSKIIRALLLTGAIKMVADSFSFKKSVTMGNWTVGI